MSSAGAGSGRPHLSVVSVFHDRAAFVSASIASVLAQTGVDFEFLVADDGSTDGTGDLLSAIADPRLRVIRHENRGLVRALNAVVRASRGRYVAIHGAGDLSLPSRLSRQAALLDERPDIGVAGCWVENMDLIAETLETVRRRKTAPLRAEALTDNPFTHGEVMFRRALFDAVGGYREVFRYAQDRDLWIRMGALSDYEMVPMVLYRRLRIPGGVSACAESMILQGMMSEFAAECGRIVDGGGQDPINRLGAAAFLLRRRSGRLARRFSHLGMKFLGSGRHEFGRRLIRAAAAERVTPTVLAALALSALSRSETGWRIVGGPVVDLALRLRRGGTERIAAADPADPSRRDAENRRAGTTT